MSVMKSSKSRSNGKRLLSDPPYQTSGQWMRENLPLLPLFVFLLFSISLLFTRWMIGESKSGYMVNLPSPKTYYALYQIRYIDEDSTAEIRDIAAESVKGVMVEQKDVLQDIRNDLELIKESGFSELGLSDSLQELISSLSAEKIAELGRYAYEVGQNIAFSEGTEFENRDKLSSFMWDLIEQTDLSRSDRNILYQILEQVIRPVISMDPEMAEDVRQTLRSRIAPVERVLLPGDVILQKGEKVTPGLAVILRAQGYPESRIPFKQIVLVICGTVLWVMWLNRKMMQIEYERHSLPGWLYVACLSGIGWCSLYLFQIFGAQSIGLILISGWAYLTLPRELAFHVVLGSSLLGAFIVAGFSAGNIIVIGLSGCGAAFLGYFMFRSVSSRTQLWRQLFFLGVFMSVLEMSVQWSVELPVATRIILLNLLYSAIGGFVSIALLPVIENLFDVLSPLRLLELNNPSHPLLKKLQLEAPGTYHHSIMVGNLAEVAADAIGLDSELIKAGAYYHDIGKLKRPHFFVENQLHGDNVHDRITPSLSALSIIAHVKEGVEFAKEYKLPGRIRDFIVEHHGKTCLSYFYRKARKQGENVNREQFCYPGPMPGSRETALLMLADSVEAAVRSDTSNISTPKDLEEIIQSVIESKVNEGQLENVDFTLKDLSKIKEALLYTLQSMYHTRRVKELPDEVEISEEGN